jgi:hypothetical protein
MKQPEESAKLKPLTLEQRDELATYPDHWRSILQKAAEQGESIKEVYEELKDLEAFM